MKVRPFEHSVRPVDVALIDARQVSQQPRANLVGRRTRTFCVMELLQANLCCKTCRTCPPPTLMCVILPVGASAGVWLILARKDPVMLHKPRPINRCKTRARHLPDLFNTFSFFLCQLPPRAPSRANCEKVDLLDLLATRAQR